MIFVCGIIGYTGYRKASEVILEGLRTLEYRGYDSAGIAVLDGKISVIKDVGRIDDIHKKLNFLRLRGNLGIGHTRWATHGGVTLENAHPHADSKGKIFLVHNGVIENFCSLRDELSKKRHVFASETDTEVIAHLLEEEAKKCSDFCVAFRNAVSKLSGSWSIVAIKEGDESIYLSRNGPPLVIGIGKDEMFCASDVPALLPYTKRVAYMEDGDCARITSDGCATYDSKGMKIKREEQTITWNSKMAEKDGYPHFMLKEIYEQQGKIRDAFSAADLGKAVSLIKEHGRLTVVACGTSYYAGLVLRQLLQSNLSIPCDVIVGSEFPYSRTGKEKLVMAISQSGETADTLSALRLAKKSGAKIIAVGNVVGSSLYREADVNVVIGAGPELAVVATKSFTCQIAALTKIAFMLAGKGRKIDSLSDLSAEIEKLLARSKEIEKMACELAKRKDFFFIGRSLSFPLALEGALKLKEITYLHAEAYAAGELKHGPLSLLEKEVVVIALAPSGESLPKIIANVQECKARDATIVVFSDDKEALEKSSLHFAMPSVPQEAIPIIYAIPLQLLAYHMALKLGRDPDKPRNLAKSVTVE